MKRVKEGMNYFDLINMEIPTYYMNNAHITYDIFSNPEYFIEKYFEAGNKNALFINDLSIFKNTKRSTHMCALYAFGTFIAERSNIGQKIEQKYESLIPSSLKNEYNNHYSYFWFLVSLYHDVGYGIQEIPKVKYDLFFHNFSIKRLIVGIIEKSIHDSKNGAMMISLFSSYGKRRFCIQKECNHFLCNNKKHCDNQTWVKHKNKKYSVNKYYGGFDYIKYFKNDNKRIKNNNNQYKTNEYFEHGILGGKIFFDNLLKAFEESICNNQSISKDFVKGTEGNIWFPEQLDIFKDLAYVIATHNLWKENFTNYGIKRTFRKISPNNSILFLLCLCDTIDPYKFLMKKTINQEEIKKTLKGIEMEFRNNQLVIYSPIESKYDIREEWYNKLESNLMAFMEIEVQQSEDEIIIKWKN